MSAAHGGTIRAAAVRASLGTLTFHEGRTTMTLELVVVVALYAVAQIAVAVALAKAGVRLQ